jgi:hypothetical protein
MLLACAPKRVEPTAPAAAPAPAPAPIATRLVAPDGGPFDFSPRPEDPEHKVAGDMAHPGQMPGYPATSPGSPR